MVPKLEVFFTTVFWYWCFYTQSKYLVLLYIQDFCLLIFTDEVFYEASHWPWDHMNSSQASHWSFHSRNRNSLYFLKLNNYLLKTDENWSVDLNSLLDKPNDLWILGHQVQTVCISWRILLLLLLKYSKTIQTRFKVST